MAVYAKIDMSSNPGPVVNTQVVNENDYLDPGFTWVDVSDMVPQPCIGWTYDGANFIEPQE